MGELVDLQSPLAGQAGLNQWLGQQDQAATPKGLLPIILPTQEMRGFQRRYKYSPGSQTLQVGESFFLTWTVPQLEYWRPLTLHFTNKDNVIKGILVTFSVDKSGNNIYRAVQTVIGLGESQIVYGQELDGAIGNTVGRFSSRLPNIMEPGDTMTMQQLQNVAILSEQSWIFVYELVPQPATPRSVGVLAAVTVT